jgi:chromosome segregation ATPase
MKKVLVFLISIMIVFSSCDMRKKTTAPYNNDIPQGTKLPGNMGQVPLKKEDSWWDWKLSDTGLGSWISTKSGIISSFVFLISSCAYLGAALAKAKYDEKVLDNRLTQLSDRVELAFSSAQRAEATAASIKPGTPGDPGARGPAGVPGVPGPAGPPGASAAPMSEIEKNELAASVYNKIRPDLDDIIIKQDNRISALENSVGNMGETINKVIFPKITTLESEIPKLFNITTSQTTSLNEITANIIAIQTEIPKLASGIQVNTQALDTLSDSINTRLTNYHTKSELEQVFTSFSNEVSSASVSANLAHEKIETIHKSIQDQLTQNETQLLKQMQDQNKDLADTAEERHRATQKRMDTFHKDLVEINKDQNELEKDRDLIKEQLEEMQKNITAQGDKIEDELKDVSAKADNATTLASDTNELVLNNQKSYLDTVGHHEQQLIALQTDLSALKNEVQTSQSTTALATNEAIQSLAVVEKRLPVIEQILGTKIDAETMMTQLKSYFQDVEIEFNGKYMTQAEASSLMETKLQTSMDKVGEHIGKTAYEALTQSRENAESIIGLSKSINAHLVEIASQQKEFVNEVAEVEESFKDLSQKHNSFIEIARNLERAVAAQRNDDFNALKVEVRLLPTEEETHEEEEIKEIKEDDQKLADGNA